MAGVGVGRSSGSPSPTKLLWRLAEVVQSKRRPNAEPDQRATLSRSTKVAAKQTSKEFNFDSKKTETSETQELGWFSWLKNVLYLEVKMVKAHKTPNIPKLPEIKNEPHQSINNFFSWFVLFLSSKFETHWVALQSNTPQSWVHKWPTSLRPNADLPGHRSFSKKPTTSMKRYG